MISSRFDESAVTDVVIHLSVSEGIVGSLLCLAHVLPTVALTVPFPSLYIEVVPCFHHVTVEVHHAATEQLLHSLLAFPPSVVPVQLCHSAPSQLDLDSFCIL